VLDRSFKASEGIRTPDPLITNQPLYLLSYAGMPSTNLPVPKPADIGENTEKWWKNRKTFSPRARMCSFFQRFNLKYTERPRIS
jgi:hypothetical protein